MNYVVTLEFPASDNCDHGYVTWKNVEAKDEEEAKDKAKIAASHLIRVNRIKETDERGVALDRK